jgi:hypothetical protein
MTFVSGFVTWVAELEVSGKTGDGVVTHPAPLHNDGGVLLGNDAGANLAIINSGSPAIKLGGMSAAELGLDPPFRITQSNCSSGMTLEAYTGSCYVTVYFRPTRPASSPRP